MNGQDWREELQELCEAVVEGRLTAEQKERLKHLVLNQAEAKRFYVEYLHQHACLHWSSADPAFLPFQPPSRADERSESRGSRRRLRRALWIAGTLAASVLLALGIWYRLSAPPVATLAAAKACKWDAGSLPTETGARLFAGRLRLAEGIARIVFDSGAEVTIEAPADLELVSPQRCVLHGGRLIATVPPRARGFVVDTPTAVLTDLGTEFGVNVSDNETADVQVFNGAVDVEHRSTKQTERLRTGRNRRYGTDAVADFDPQGEKPASLSLPPPEDPAARVVHISTALGKGKDTYVQPLFPSPNSSDILLLVKNTVPDKSNYNRKAYLGFDLSPVAGMKILDAQLTLTYVPTGMGFAAEVPDAVFSLYGLTDESLDGWDAASLRWKQAPANRDGAALDPEKVLLLGKFEIVQGAPQGTRTIAGEPLARFLNRDGNGLATLILVRDTRGSGRSDLVHGFSRRNHPYLPPPTLKLTVLPADRQ